MTYSVRTARSLIVAAVLLSVGINEAEETATIDFADLDSPAHDYWREALQDPFTRIRGDLEGGAIALDRSSESAFVASLLDALEVPVSTQMLVYSTTSLQLRLITPQSPRALYFGDDIYVGYVPGGKIEIVSIDPELGGIFYIFDIPKGTEAPEAERSRRCMNCHSGEDTREVPGVVIKSVIPGPRGGSLDSFRRGQAGHEIPYEERFGGWYVTGGKELGSQLGNQIGQFRDGEILMTALTPGVDFDWGRFPVSTSDVLAHLLHEHQAGFVNRVAELHYRWRGGPEAVSQTVLDDLVRYLLFAGEPNLPNGGIQGDPELKSAFLSKRRVSSGGQSLRDLDLETRLFRHRCSYMIYRPQFLALPETLKEMIYRTLAGALDLVNPDLEYSYLPESEKRAIREILEETHPDLNRWPTAVR